MTSTKLAVAGLCALLLACGGGSGASPGASGGKCRVTGDACDPGLECLENICTPPGGFADGSIGPDGPVGERSDASPFGTPDARPIGNPDARPGTPDAAIDKPIERTLTHSASQTVTAGTSAACSVSKTGEHTDNSYYRVFDLSDFGIGGAFAVDTVQVGIEQATSGGGTQPITIRLHRLSGALTLANLTLITTASRTVADTTLSVEDFAVTGTFSPTDNLVVEVFTPAGAGNALFVGSNSSGQTDPTYIMAAGCGLAEITDVSDAEVGFPGMHFVLNVLGTEFP